VLIDSDSKKDIATRILSSELNITATEIKRFATGYCHSVYHVKSKTDEYVLRLTTEENKGYYFDSVKWLNKLAQMEMPVPKILKHGHYGEVYYTLITFICGRDLGEVYHMLNDPQKRDIVKELSEIQRKVSTLPSINLYGYDNHSFATWVEYPGSLIDRSRKRIIRNKVFDAEVCDSIAVAMNALKDYLSNVEPVAFLDDITTKNVLIHNGKLAGIVDIDGICYGDPLLAVGLTNMALLAMEADTKYIDYWLEELDSNTAQRKAVTFYTLLFCIDFMGEQGMKFDNGNIVAVSQEKTELLTSIYRGLLSKF